MITGTTKLMCLLGNPVDHSLSPAIHNELCRLNGFDGVYAAFSPEKESLEAAIMGLKSLGCIGFNVTYPYKEAVVPFLDEIHEDAEILKAVNTVVIQNDTLIGYNTDVFGFEQLLVKNNVDVKGQTVCILGTGGASRAVAVSFKNLGAKKIDFYSREIQENAFIEQLKSFCDVEQVTYDFFDIKKPTYSVIVNGTPLGMGAYKNKSAIEPENLMMSTVLIDLIYNPEKTKLLTNAGERGYNIINGYDMLYYQGLKAFEYWTDIYRDYYSDIKTLLINRTEET
ncbi:MAG: shikimate dehydrogenase [Clostridia bacterium]|nr:shikimate dehydrogenase [Clostridia bacterium]